MNSNIQRTPHTRLIKYKTHCFIVNPKYHLKAKSEHSTWLLGFLILLNFSNRQSVVEKLFVFISPRPHWPLASPLSISPRSRNLCAVPGMPTRGRFLCKYKGKYFVLYLGEQTTTTIKQMLIQHKFSLQQIVFQDFHLRLCCIKFLISYFMAIPRVEELRYLRALLTGNRKTAC